VCWCRFMNDDANPGSFISLICPMYLFYVPILLWTAVISMEMESPRTPLCCQSLHTSQFAGYPPFFLPYHSIPIHPSASLCGDSIPCKDSPLVTAYARHPINCQARQMKVRRRHLWCDGLPVSSRSRTYKHPVDFHPDDFVVHAFVPCHQRLKYSWAFLHIYETSVVSASKCC
jgi:hypothetical protein